ncbi:hypothetical protein [Pseudomonas viridiflava]|uniref:hypothetical protein n=1 Tax=Pseudomonas viridiflava TaxID=33069 RepID=UPI000F033CB3|nr:hypothetical protein [Pseudomonas viridiflava]
MNHAPEPSGVAGHTFTIGEDYEGVSVTSRALWVDCLNDVESANDDDVLAASLARAEGFLVNLQLADSIDARERARLERVLSELVQRRTSGTPEDDA